MSSKNLSSNQGKEAPEPSPLHTPFAALPEEGVVKYRCDWQPSPPPDASMIAPLMKWRQWCFRHKVIGVYPDGIGYGNISMRSDGGFIISGTQTGMISNLSNEGYSEVVEADIEKNYLLCRGEVAASSEALTHAMFYQLDPKIGGVIHIHHRELWRQLLGKAPTTREEVPYGTPEMAEEIARLWKESNLSKERVVAMAGHEEGIIVFGNDLEEAGKVLRQIMEKEDRR